MVTMFWGVLADGEQDVARRPESSWGVRKQKRGLRTWSELCAVLYPGGC